MIHIRIHIRDVIVFLVGLWFAVGVKYGAEWLLKFSKIGWSFGNLLAQHRVWVSGGIKWFHVSP